MRVTFCGVWRRSGGSSLEPMDSLNSYISVSQALVVADHGSISRAAQILGVRQTHY